MNQIYTVFFRGILFCVLIVPTLSFAADDDDDIFKDRWKEIKLKSPAPPKSKDLLAVEIPARFSQKIFIDPASVSYDADRVIRYTMVVESSSGVRSIFYEGLHCTRERYKRYAYLVENKFKPLQQSKWKELENYGFGSIRLFFWRYIFCDENGRARKPKEIIRQIKYPENPHDWAS